MPLGVQGNLKKFTNDASESQTRWRLVAGFSGRGKMFTKDVTRVNFFLGRRQVNIAQYVTCTSFLIGLRLVNYFFSSFPELKISKLFPFWRSPGLVKRPYFDGRIKLLMVRSMIS